jgi:hypothetical protein
MRPHRLETISGVSLHPGKPEVDIDAARPLRVMKGDSVFGKGGCVRIHRALAPPPLPQALKYDLKTVRVHEDIHIS